jgi:hypothetical protein
MEKFAFGLGAIVCLTALEISALATHTDGAYFAPIMAAIGGIVGGLLGLTVNVVKAASQNVEDPKEKN